MVKRYIRDSPLHSGASSSQASGSEGWDLEAVVAAVASKLGPRGPPLSSGCMKRVGVDDGTRGSVLAADTAGQLEAERSAGSEMAKPTCEDFVLNASSGTYHRRVLPPTGRTACGWSYEAHAHALVPDWDAGPKSWVQLCSRCWPSLRDEARCTGVLRLGLEA